MSIRVISCLLLVISTFLITPAALAEFDSMPDGPPGYTVDVSKIPDAIPVALPLSSTGNPPYYDVNGKRYYVLKSSKGYKAEGTASWYGTKFQGKKTSSGEPYDMFAMTAASPTLPIPSYVQVTNLKNGKQVIVKVNDRGPFHEGRILDLSYVAAKKLGILNHGTVRVSVAAIETGVSKKKSNLYLQVATFKIPDNASSLAKRLESSLSSKVFISPTASTADRVLYRVLVGPLGSLDQSELLKKRLIALGLTGNLTVQQFE